MTAEWDTNRPLLAGRLEDDEPALLAALRSALTASTRMRVVLLRAGIGAGCGGIQGPLFEDGTFEFVCIPDSHRVSARTYGNMIGKDGKPQVRRGRTTSPGHGEGLRERKAGVAGVADGRDAEAGRSDGGRAGVTTGGDDRGDDPVR